MTEKNQPFKIGDSVKVKPDVHEPDFGENIGGWVGRVLDIEDETILVEWDSLTLLAMTAESISQSEREALDWASMSLYPSELELTQARDTSEDTEKAYEELEHLHQWDSLGEEGERIQSVLQQADSDDEWSAFEAWEKYFRRVLKFPFEAEVTEEQRGPVRQGNTVKVLGIDEIVERHGIIVKISYKQSMYYLPLCDLEVTKESSPNYQPVKDHAVWFANR
ncbi:conserved hypothetical protein [Crenothrix polyspora]|uniref:DUF4314 domain-containing protein n=1 Tax=Crenothrix polyspora TaxID=360316 RepID=A0A1R4HG20_9GAMM|nr:calcium-binding protein [Crenothrix polyspora]SJM95196.1 conserved hypothetical protein [Crenothrix polyspora]